MIPEKRETNEVSPIITLAHCRRQFPGFSAGRGESKQSLDVLLIEKTDFRVQEANVLEFAGQSPRDGELNIYPEICRSVSWSLWLSTVLHTHERKGQGKSH